MTDSPENPFRSPESELRPPRSLALVQRRIFGAVAFSLGICLALSTLIALAQIVATGVSRQLGLFTTDLAFAATAYWLIRLGRREWRAGKP